LTASGGINILAAAGMLCNRAEEELMAVERGLGLRQSLITGAGISAGAALGLASTASAASFAVDTTADTAPALGECVSPILTDCSLRQAIDAANANANPTVIDQITFNSGVTGTLTLGASGQMLISDPVYINGPPPGSSTLTWRARTCCPSGSIG
jgi:hypothetical protein